MATVPKNSLFNGETLKNDESLTYFRYGFVMQKDGNLVLYKDGKPIWAAGTNGPNRVLKLLTTGNLVVFSGTSEIWSSNTAGNAFDTYRLDLQGDGNVVLYNSSNAAIWATNTQNK